MMKLQQKETAYPTVFATYSFVHLMRKRKTAYCIATARHPLMQNLRNCLYFVCSVMCY